MRIWLRPDRMAQLGVTVADIASAVTEQNAQYAAGKIGAPPNNSEELTLTVTAKGRLLEPEQFAGIVIRTGEKGAVVRLSDVARVELGSKDYNFYGRVNGHASGANRRVPANRRQCAARPVQRWRKPWLN